jgi:uncharacterized protein YhhL (DUF1145 family)
MNLLSLIIEAAKLAIAAIILFYVVEMITPMPQNMRRVVQLLIGLIVILTVLSMAIGEPVRPLPSNIR